MFNKLRAPERFELDHFFERARYKLSYNISLFLTLALCPMSIIFFLFFNPVNAILTAIGGASSLIGFLYIRKTGNYKGYIAFFNIIALLLCQSALYLIPDQPHIVEGFWMLTNIVLAFITLSPIFAFTITSIHILGLSYFYLENYNHQIELFETFNSEQLYSFTTNVFVSFLATAYLVYQSVKTNQSAELKLELANIDLQKKNSEAITMLKEIHHRVKNNLQIIISLLRLQTSELKSEEAIEKFKLTTQRVISMAMIHEKMYQSDELSQLNLNDYFLTLGNDVIDSYNLRDAIKLTIDADFYSKDIKSLVPLGLIYNELLSNSLKHAFNGQSGEISLTILNNGGDLHMKYTDTGEWKIPTGESSFGMELIETLTDQLNGQLKMETHPTTFTLTLNNFNN